MSKKIFYWGPYSGHVGTVKAQINSALALHQYGGYDISLIRAHSEFVGFDDELNNKSVNVFDLGLSRIFPGLENSDKFSRRPYMLVCSLFGVFKLIKLLRKERPDVIILNLLVVPALLAIKVSRVEVKTVVSVQGFPQFLDENKGGFPLWKRMENHLREYMWNKVYPTADAVITMTRRTRIKLAENTRIDSEHLYTVNNPVVDDSLFELASQPIEHRWYSNRHKVIVAMGRLSYQKGFDVLLKAFVRVIESCDNCKLIIVGEGEDRTKLMELSAELGISRYVDLVGHKDNPFPYLVNAELFVLSSRWEDPGHAIVEAAALGVPIVTTDCPSGPSELVSNGDAGFVCRTNDELDMSEKIISALTEYDEKKVRRAKENANNFTQESHYNQMMRVLDVAI